MHVRLCLRKSMHAVQVLISAPLNGHVLLKCLYMTTCLSRGLRAGSGQRGGGGGGRGGGGGEERMVKDSYAID